MRRLVAAFGAHSRKADLRKKREIQFARFPPGQIPEAIRILDGLEGLGVNSNPTQDRSINVEYEITDYTLRGLENGLIDQGFHLDNTLFSKLVRALIYYSEETQLHNLGAPERLTKRPDQAYVHAWDQRKHGDHDDTPPDLRNQL